MTTSYPCKISLSFIPLKGLQSMKKFRKELITIILFLMICFVTVFLVNRGSLREEENQKVDSAATDESHFSEGYIEVGVHILAIDPLDEHINVELEFKPHGRFDQ